MLQPLIDQLTTPMESSRQEHSSLRPNWLTANLDKLGNQVVEIGHTVKKLSQDDPRRIVHGVKVGLAITLISLLYYFEPLFEGFGVAAMWAVLTVVVVFEFSVGKTSINFTTSYTNFFMFNVSFIHFAKL